MSDRVVVTPTPLTFDEFAREQFILQCAAYETRAGTNAALEAFWPSTDRGFGDDHVFQHVTDGTVSNPGQVWTLYIDDEASSYLIVKTER